MAHIPQIFPFPYADADVYEDFEILIRKHKETTKKIKNNSVKMVVSSVVFLSLSFIGFALVSRMVNVPYEVFKKAVFYPLSIATGIQIITIVGTIVILLYRNKRLKDLEAEKPGQTELTQINS